MASGANSVRISAACTACGICLSTCPTRALRPAPARPLVVDKLCTSCLACIEICPTGAITEIDLRAL
ncbi:MAG: 4Fe-4S binding protein [Acidimicrobiales bacterium]